MTNVSSSPASLQKLAHGQCFEDINMILTGLRISAGDNCLCIGSAGDNALSMLIHNPNRLIIVEPSVPQIALIELKIAAIKNLEQISTIKFLGGIPCKNRIQLFEKCSKSLSASSREYWEKRINQIEQGVISCGLFEQYLSLYKKNILNWANIEQHIDPLMNSQNQQQQMLYFEDKWQNIRYKVLSYIWSHHKLWRYFFKDNNLFPFVKPYHENHMTKRLNTILATQDIKHNPYLNWILFGHYHYTLPVYLRAKYYEVIKANLNKVELNLCPIEAYLDQAVENKINKFHLSDIFDLFSYEDYCNILEKIIQHSDSKTRLTYFNFMVPRNRPNKLAHKITTNLSLARALKQNDRLPFYDQFVIEELL